MLYYAYKHFWFFKVHKMQTQRTINRESTIDELKSKVGLTTIERQWEYDECWPVRYSWRYRSFSFHKYNPILRQLYVPNVNENTEDALSEAECNSVATPPSPPSDVSKCVVGVQTTPNVKPKRAWTRRWMRAWRRLDVLR